MVDDEIAEAAENKATTAEALDRARLARERREAEQKKRLDELRAHAAAAQALRERRDEERRQRQAEQRQRDEDRRQQVEERKRAIWEASVSWREALMQRERERSERLERARAARTSPRTEFAFGSSTPRLLEPIDSSGCFWAARSTDPVDQTNLNFLSPAASTTNVMFASAPITRRGSALQLNSDDNKDEPERQQVVMRSSVARRRTDLVPTIVMPRAPEMRSPRSGETTPGSRPGSAMSGSTQVVRRNAGPRKPRPASVAGTGVHTPKGGGGGGGDSSAAPSEATTPPSVSRDSTMTPVPRRPKRPPRHERPVSLLIQSTDSSTTFDPAKGKPPLHRKPNVSKETDKTSRGKSLSPSPMRPRSPLLKMPKELSVSKENNKPNVQVNVVEIKQKLEALQIKGQNAEDINDKTAPKPEKDPQDKPEDNEITAAMTARRITTEEEAKAALAERRRKAREELERQAEVERQRLQREAEEEAERQRLEEERQRCDEEEAKELARLQRQMEEEKLKKAIEAQQQLEREEAERKARDEAERVARLREEEEKRRAAEEAERARREEAEREERERLARKQRVEAIMARTRLNKQEDDKKQEESKPRPPANPAPVPQPQPQTDNGNAADTPTEVHTNLIADQSREQVSETNNGNVSGPLGLTPASNAGNVSASFIQTERMSAEHTQSKLPEKGPQLIEDDFIAHNGHGANHNHPLTLQNAI